MDEVKLLIIEYIQASAFAAVITFWIALIGVENQGGVAEATFVALIVGGIPLMLSKHFLIGFMNEVRKKP